jgi:hypothetical protein
MAPLSSGPAPRATSAPSTSPAASTAPPPTPATQASAIINYTKYAEERSRPVKEGPRGTSALPVSHELTYVWEYHAQRIDLRALYEKSKDLMWNARTDLAWDTKVDPEGVNAPDMMIPIFGTPVWDKLDPKRDVPRLRHHMWSYMISNFLHGEQGALLATSQLVACAPTPDAKMYASAQVFDEARHVEAYDRYLRDKLELVYPVSPYLKTLLDVILTDSRWDMKYLGMQIMVEGVALGAFGLIHQFAQEPLIKQVTEMIMRDESRHVAFGVLSLKDTYEGMKQSELRDREDFLIESSRLLRDRFLGQEIWANLGLPQKECEEAVESSEAMKLFRKLLFSKIVPNVKRLGLLTPYVREGFEKLGVIEFENAEPSA